MTTLIIIFVQLFVFLFSRCSAARCVSVRAASEESEEQVLVTKPQGEVISAKRDISWPNAARVHTHKKRYD